MLFITSISIGFYVFYFILFVLVLSLKKIEIALKNCLLTHLITHEYGITVCIVKDGNADQTVEN